MESERVVARVCPVALGLAGGFLWALAILVFALLPEYGAPIVDFMSHYYLGYKAGFVGGLIGALWGFFDAGIGFALIAALYNFFVAKLAKCAKSKCCLMNKCHK